MDIRNTYLNQTALRVGVSTLAALAVCLLYRHTLTETARSFSDPLGSMSHGWLIPLLSIHALWRQRAPLLASEKRYSLAGTLGMLAALALLWAGNRYSLLWLRQLSFIGILWSLIFALWGREIARLTMFPVWYLAFTISAPSALENLTGELQTVSATAGAHLMRGFNVEVLQNGHALFSPAEGAEFRLDIAAPCSGIRSLLALTAFTALYAWHTQKGVLRKWLLFLCSVPIAVLANVVRVFSICLVAAVFGESAAVGYYHDYSGYAAVLAAILLIFSAGNLPEKLSG
jgi:exosortase